MIKSPLPKSNDKSFVTIVPHIENLELKKDTGQLPYHFFKALGYQSTLVSYYYTLKGGRKAGPVAHPPKERAEVNLNYPYLLSEVPGLNMHFLAPIGRGKFYEKAILNYLKANAKNIAILNLFHFSPENIFYVLVYKILNPKGKAYIKLDIDIDFFNNKPSLFNSSGIFGKLKNGVFTYTLLPLFFKLINLVSAESIAGYEYFKGKFKISPKKITLIPNGVDLEHVYALTNGVKTFNEKENILLTVGRIGNLAKNHQMLLDVIPTIAATDWKFYFAGPIAEEFKENINDFFENYPSLKERVIFTGNITDPTQLYELYNRAKIFCLTSIWEGFPMAAVEAGCYGNIMVLNEKIHAFSTLTDNGKHGFSINEANFSKTLNHLINDHNLQLSCYKQTLAYAQLHFSWTKAVKKIDQLLHR